MKIKEVEKLLHINAQTIRYYEKLGFLNPQRDNNGYRHYTKEDVQILKRIRFLRELDISLEMIGMILKNPEKFQTMIEMHIRNLKAQVEHLELIEKRCENIRQKNVPLIDAIIDGEFDDFPEMSVSKIKNVLQKAKNAMKPYAVVTLGRKTTPFQLIKILCIYFIGTLIVMSGFKSFLYQYDQTEISFVMVLLLSVVLSALIMITAFHEKYYEFGNEDLVFYNSKEHHIFKSIGAVLKNNTEQYARHFHYEDIESVTIVNKKYYSGVGFGISQCIKNIYHIRMKNGETFTINTSLYHHRDQQRQLVYDILKHYQIPVIEKAV
ncbi:MerR family transcriptional regulator [[Clostridium] spiroforme]|nr:MerR family transcriptional regulator [Thomasclavelia spiroformis]